MSKREQIMESGCMEDYRHSLTTEGDMTYSEPDWYKRVSDQDADVQGAIEMLRGLGYTVVLPAEFDYDPDTDYDPNADEIRSTPEH